MIRIAKLNRLNLTSTSWANLNWYSRLVPGDFLRTRLFLDEILHSHFREKPRESNRLIVV